MISKSLHLKWPFGKTFGLSLIVLTLLVGVSEVIFRTDRFQSLLTAPKMGTLIEPGHKLVQLEAATEQEGLINCLILGNSMVDVGFDPKAFAIEYKNRTGQDIRCFNFGIDGLTAASAGPLAHILVQDYRPSLLIYGTDARDYAISRDALETTVILDTPWIQHRQGNPSVEGWLWEHSYLYRYRSHIRNLLRFYFEETLRSHSILETKITPYGFRPLKTVETNVTISPDPEDDSPQNNYYFGLLSNYEMREENLSGLEQIISQNGQNTQVIIVEMPVPSGYFYFFGNGKDDYQRFIDKVSHLAEAYNVLFWQTTTLQMIPDSGWRDYSHLNIEGAKIFSKRLGQQVGQAVLQGKINNLTP